MGNLTKNCDHIFLEKRQYPSNMRRTTYPNNKFDAQAKMCVKFNAQSTFLSISFREYLKSNKIKKEAAISIFCY